MAERFGHSTSAHVIIILPLRIPSGSPYSFLNTFFPFAWKKMKVRWTLEARSPLHLTFILSGIHGVSTDCFKTRMSKSPKSADTI